MNAIDDSLALPIWTQSAGEEVANGISHGIGLVGAMIGTPILVVAALHHSNLPFLIGTIIFAATMLLVYLASTLYHCWPRTDTKSLLQVIDHSAIFLLIANGQLRFGDFFWHLCVLAGTSCRFAAVFICATWNSAAGTVGQAWQRSGLIVMLPVEHDDPVNAKILAVSEDKIEGFVGEPFEEIANRSGVGVAIVMARIAAMLRAGTIRRVRQTLLATNIAEGALVAWKVREQKIDAAFDWM